MNCLSSLYIWLYSLFERIHLIKFSVYNRGVYHSEPNANLHRQSDDYYVNFRLSGGKATISRKVPAGYILYLAFRRFCLKPSFQISLSSFWCFLLNSLCFVTFLVYCDLGIKFIKNSISWIYSFALTPADDGIPKFHCGLQIARVRSCKYTGGQFGSVNNVYIAASFLFFIFLFPVHFPLSQRFGLIDDSPLSLGNLKGVSKFGFYALSNPADYANFC